MGWSWAVHFVQTAHVHLLRSKLGGQWTLVTPDHPGSLRSSDMVISVYIDDVFILSHDLQLLLRVHDELRRIYADAGLVISESKSGPPAAHGKVLGLDFDGTTGAFQLPADKQTRLATAIDELLHLPYVSARMLQSVLGVWLWAALLCRPALSALCIIHRWIESHTGKQPAPLSPAVRRELFVMRALIPLLRASCTSPFSGVLLASDASDSGLGVAQSAQSPNAVRHLIATSSAKAPPRSTPAQPGESQQPYRLPPQHWLPGRAHWVTLFSGRWRASTSQHTIIAAKEMAAVQASLLHLRSTNPSSHSFLHFVDNQSVLGVLLKGRTSSSLAPGARRVAGILLACGFVVHWRWIPTGDNPADAPSRAFEHSLGFQHDDEQ